MALTLQQLLTPVTEEEAVQTLLDWLTGLGFSASSWQSGSRQRTFVQIAARMWQTLSNATVPNIAKGGFNELATGLWLKIFSESHYDNTPTAAVTTQGTVSLIASAQAPGPTAIGASALVFKDSVNGFTYRNRFAFTLTPASTHQVEVEAEVAASNRDVATNTITVMETPIAGCSVTNPALGVTGTWITRNGADAESDSSLQGRNRSKWGTLGIAPGVAYEYYAKQGHESVRRVWVDATNPQGPGTVDVYIAGDSGSLVPSIVTAVQDYLDGTTDGFDRTATTATLEVKSATDATVIIVAAVYILKQQNTAANQALITKSIQDYFKTVPVGGVRDADLNPGVVPIGGLYAAIIQNSGVQNVSFSSPSGDYPLLKSEVAVPSITLTYYPI